MVLDGVSFELRRGETLGVVGESGCGKSVTALAILRLIAQPPGRITGGRVIFEGRDLLQAVRARMREVRGNRISMIFQEPMTSLNPAYTVGDQIAEAVRLHEGLSRRGALQRAHRDAAPGGHPGPGAPGRTSTRTSSAAACASA
jgi:peptide/nickel transport system ATP-binding protein